jgi:hypothetical protein
METDELGGVPVALDAFIHCFEILAATNTIRSMPDIHQSVQTLLADLYLMRRTGDTDSALIKSRLDKVIGTIEVAGRRH